MRKPGRRVDERSEDNPFDVTDLLRDGFPFSVMLRYAVDNNSGCAARMEDFSDHNIFEMSVENGGPGFWIRRTTWGNTCARVVGLGAFTQAAPYYGNPPVVMDVYSSTGEIKDSLAKVPAAGTYKTWRRIDPPVWAARSDLRPLSDPSIGKAIQQYDRRR